MSGSGGSSISQVVTFGIHSADSDYGCVHSLTETLCDFFSDIAPDLCGSGRVYFEVVYKQDPETGKSAGFELIRVGSNQIVNRWGRYYQSIPSEIAKEHNVSRKIALDADNLLAFALPSELRSSVRDLCRSLDALDRNRFPDFILHANKTNVPYDYKAHERTQNLALMEAAKKIGWEARGLFQNAATGYYTMLLLLRFERFLSVLRRSMVSDLNMGLSRIGQKIGFNSKIQVLGLPTVEEVDQALEDLKSGCAPFAELFNRFQD